MLVKIVIEVSGLEKLALGKQLERWDMKAIPEGGYVGPDVGDAILGEYEVPLPAAESGVQAVLESMREEESSLRNKLNEDLASLENRRSKLLAISMSPQLSEDNVVVTELSRWPATNVGELQDCGEALSADWKNSMTCVKTGCALVVSGYHYWGDLFTSNDTQEVYWFNSNPNSVQSMEDSYPIGLHIITMPDAATIRYGQVFTSEFADLTPELTAYINSAPF